MLSDASGPDAPLRQLRRLNADIQAAAVVSAEGEVLALAADASLADLMAPTVLLMATAAARAAQEVGRGALRGFVIEGSHGLVVGRDLGDGRVLAAVGGPTARLGLLLDDVRACAELVDARPEAA